MVFNPYKLLFMLLGVDDELQTNLMCGNETVKTVNKKKIKRHYLQQTQLCNAFSKNRQKCAMPTSYQTKLLEIMLACKNEKSIHQKCIEPLMIEVYKYLNSCMIFSN